MVSLRTIGTLNGICNLGCWVSNTLIKEFQSQGHKSKGIKEHPPSEEDPPSQASPENMVSLDMKVGSSIVGAEELFQEAQPECQLSYSLFMGIRPKFEVIPKWHYISLKNPAVVQVRRSGIGLYCPPRGAQAEVESESGDWIWEVLLGLHTDSIWGFQQKWVPFCESLQ